MEHEKCRIVQQILHCIQNVLSNAEAISHSMATVELELYKEEQSQTTCHNNGTNGFTSSHLCGDINSSELRQLTSCNSFWYQNMYKIFTRHQDITQQVLILLLDVVYVIFIDFIKNKLAYTIYSMRQFNAYYKRFSPITD